MARNRQPPRHHSFQMPSVQTMVSRKSSITNAFVNSIIPVVVPGQDEVLEALSVLEISPDDLRCAYCGDTASEWDHLRPLVLNRRPTGYISELANLVPSCGKCNQSKGNKEWRIWIRSDAPRSPATREVPDLEKRIERLERYEHWREVKPIDFESLVAPEFWARYWDTCEEVVQGLRDSQGLADQIKEQIARARATQQS